jgi:alpha,alpha-trehalase
VVDCAYQWAAQGGRIGAQLWEHLQALVRAARREWWRADCGIWEVRTQGRPFTYSAALCHVALDRGAHLAERFGFSGEIYAWRGAAQEIQRAILAEAWDSRLNSLTEQLGGGALDASLLALPLRRVVGADHPKMIATTAAIAERLGAGHGLLYRYNPEISPDGLPGAEGAFLICSFWLVDNLGLRGNGTKHFHGVDSSSPVGLCGRRNCCPGASAPG